MKTGRELIAEIDAARVESGDAVFWWLGQHSFVVRTCEAVVWLDPYLTPDEKRTVPPLLAPEEVTNADVILGTHDHADHIDRPALPGMAAASPRARFIFPRTVTDGANPPAVPAGRMLGLDAEEGLQTGGVQVTAIAAAHEFFDVDPERGHPYLGYIVRSGDVTIYHAGDTLKYEGLETRLKRQPIDLALLPINGRDARRLARNCIGNMTYQEAVDLAGAVRPRLTVPTHYEMFASNAEDPALFADYMRVKFPGVKFWIGEHGVPVRLSDAASGS